MKYSYNDIKNIYDRLGDDESKKCFDIRLNYLLTRDQDMIIQDLIEFGRERGVDYQCEFGGQTWEEFVEENKLNKNKLRIVIFGAGGSGKNNYYMLCELGYKDNITCFCDNNSSNYDKTLMGLPICSPLEAIEVKGDSIIVVSSLYGDEIVAQLLAMGIEKNRIFFPEGGCIYGTICGTKQYFDLDRIKPNVGEIFIDGGAFDGKSSIDFINWCKGEYEKIYLFEPVFPKECEENMQQIKAKNYSVIDKGMWDCEDTLYFFNGGTGSRITSEITEDCLSVTSIDKILDGQKATFIKMDIEGSELKALHGAADTIKKWSPKLAICVYHKVEDIVEIPLYILKLNPEYKLYLRQYRNQISEMVLYAVI